MEVFGELKNAYLEKDNAGKTALGAVCCGDNVTSEFDPLLTATPNVLVGNGTIAKRLVVSDELSSVNSTLSGRVSAVEAATSKSTVYSNTLLSPAYSVFPLSNGSIVGGVLTKNGTCTTISIIGEVVIDDNIIFSVPLPDGTYDVDIVASSGPIRSRSYDVGLAKYAIENDCAVYRMALAIVSSGGGAFCFSAISTGASNGIIQSTRLVGFGVKSARLRIGVADGTITSSYIFYPVDSSIVPLTAGSKIQAVAGYAGPSAYREITVGVLDYRAIAMTLYFNKL